MSSLDFYYRSKLPRVPFKVRKDLIQLVQEKNLSIKRACRKLKLNYSTGKLIMKKYRNQGKITKFSYEKSEASESSQIDSANINENTNRNESQLLDKNIPFYHNPTQIDTVVWFWVPTVSSFVETGKYQQFLSWNAYGAEITSNSNPFMMSFY